MEMKEDPVTLWIDQLRESDDSAATKLWQHFMRRLYESARYRIRPATRRVYDEEDAAQSAFKSVCGGIAGGRFPDLHDREGLCRLLLRVTALKVAERHRHDRRERRDVRRNVSDSVFDTADGSRCSELEHLPTREPTPEFAAQFVELCGLLFDRLKDPILQQVASLRMEGYNDTEISERLTCSRRTVQRRLESIRRHLENLESGIE